MNQRIESLIELSEVWNTDGDVDKCEVDLYKFAELIVLECALVANLHNEDAEGVNLGVGKVIKEHFGVE